MMDSLIGGGSQHSQTPQQQAVYINPDNLTQRQKRACEILFRNQNNIQG